MGCITEKSDTGTSTAETGAQKMKSLEDILTSDTPVVPCDLSIYNKVVQSVLAPYQGTAPIVALYVTVQGKGEKDGTSWENAAEADALSDTLSGIDEMPQQIRSIFF